MSRKPIIVDGVDVSGCTYRAEEKCILKDDECCFFPNCDYKNWQRKEQECEEWKHQAELGVDTTDRLTKELEEKEIVIDQLKAENKILEKDKANLDAIKETLKAQFKQLEKENVKLKELVKTRIEDLCDSCGASSMMPMPCKVYEQVLTEIKEICNSVWGNGLDEEVDKFGLILQKCEVLKDE